MIVDQGTVIKITNKEEFDLLFFIAEKYNGYQLTPEKKEFGYDLINDGAPLYFDFNWYAHPDIASFVDEYETVIPFDDFLSTIKVKISKISKNGYDGGWLHYVNVKYDVDTFDILEKILRYNNITEDSDFGTEIVSIFDNKTYDIDDDDEVEEVLSFNKFIKKYTKVKGAKKNLD